MPHTQFNCSSFRAQLKHRLHCKPFLDGFLGHFSGQEMPLPQGSRVTWPRLYTYGFTGRLLHEDWQLINHWGKAAGSLAHCWPVLCE